MWSDTIRKKNVINYCVGKDVLSPEFIRLFSQSLAFRRKNREGLRRCYGADTGESEKKYESRMHADMPQYVKNGSAYDVTNICDGPEKTKVLQTRNRNGGTKQNSRHRGDGDDDDDETNEERDVAPRRPRLGKQRCPQPAAIRPQSAAVSGWTLAALNKESVETLRDMCTTQGLDVAASNGRRCVKADYVAALLEAEGSFPDQSNAPLDGADDCDGDAAATDGDAAATDASSVSVGSDPAVVSSGVSLLESSVSKELLPCGSDCEAIVTSQPECLPIHSVPSLPAMSVDASPAATVPATAAPTDRDGCLQKVTNEAQRELDSFLADCEEDQMDPFQWHGEEVSSQEMELFEQDMEANVVGSELMPLEPDREETVMRTQPPRIEASDAVKAKTIGPWKRKFAENLADSHNWKPSVIVDVKRSKRGRNLRNKGAPLRSVTLSRADGKQFTVMLTGCVFYLLNTPAGVELIKICEIFHPAGGENESEKVCVEYHRVLKGSDAAEVCDRPENLSNIVQGSDGRSVVCTSSGSKEIRWQMEQRIREGKKELYHWGDVSSYADAENLLGAVYWLTIADESDVLVNTEFRKSLLAGIKDKIPITDLMQLDFVVVGSSFSDIKT
jgi:hypothetical protein